MLIWLSLLGAIKGLNIFPLISPLLWVKRGIIHLVKISVILSPLISQKVQIWEMGEDENSDEKEKDFVSDMDKWKWVGEDWFRGNRDGSWMALSFKVRNLLSNRATPLLRSRAFTPSHIWALTCMQMGRLSLKELPKGPRVGNCQACLPC